MAMTPIGAQALSPLMATLAVIGILYGALAALAQTDVKRLVAYSSVSHMGFIILGLFSLNATGMDGAVIQMVNHGLTTGRPVRLRRRDLRAVPHPRDGRAGRALEPAAALGVLLHPGVAGLGRLAGPERVRRRVPDPAGDVPDRAGPAPSWRRSGMILGAYYLLWMLQKVVFGPLQRARRTHHARPRRPRAGGRPRRRSARSAGTRSPA